MADGTSQHILPTAANLLGFCLFVITSLHITQTATTSSVDEVASIIALMLSISCLLSFMSIKTQHASRGRLLESIADYFFIASIIGIVLVISLMVFNYVK